MKRKEKVNEGITAKSLMSLMGVTSVDNVEGFTTAIPWKSKIAGQFVKGLMQYHHFLESMSKSPDVYGPLSIAAFWQDAMLNYFVIGPLRIQARYAVQSGRNPDLFAEMNSRIYKSYAQLLYELCGHCMKKGVFDRRKARTLTTTEKGKGLLKEYIEKFTELEKNYNSIGLTRLRAMKDLLKSILITITETPLEGEPIPFMGKKPDGSDAISFEEYLSESRRRLENLYQHNAFDIRDYSERATGGKIGYSPYEVIQGSQLHSVRLRYYPLPQGVATNGKALYLVTPLINLPEIYDLAQGKSVVEGMLREGYHIYLVDHGQPGEEEVNLGLDFYGKTVPDYYLDIIKRRHPGEDIYIMAYCMAGTIMLPYLARRAEERFAQGDEMDIKKIALMASPVKFDDDTSGHGPMREVIRHGYDSMVMRELFDGVNIPPQVIESGMNEIQPGVQYTVSLGFYARAHFPHAVEDAAPFLYWLTHGTRFPVAAHRDWIEKIFLGNQIFEGKYRLPSPNPALNDRPVNMNVLREAGVRIFCYRGTRDPIAPVGSCVASEIWGLTEDNIGISRGGLNRTIEKNIGHIFVVSKQLLAEYLQIVSEFFRS